MHNDYCKDSPNKQHCFHSPRYWWGVGPVPKICCWCAKHKQPDHGPYSDGHGRYKNMLENFEKIRQGIDKTYTGEWDHVRNSRIANDEWVDNFKT